MYCIFCSVTCIFCLFTAHSRSLAIVNVRCWKRAGSGHDPNTAANIPRQHVTDRGRGEFWSSFAFDAQLRWSDFLWLKLWTYTYTKILCRAVCLCKSVKSTKIFLDLILNAKVGGKKTLLACVSPKYGSPLPFYPCFITLQLILLSVRVFTQQSHRHLSPETNVVYNGWSVVGSPHSPMYRPGHNHPTDSSGLCTMCSENSRTIWRYFHDLRC